MKTILAIILAVLVGVGFGYALNRWRNAPTGGANLNVSSTNRSTGNINGTFRNIVRGPYPTDADGCAVINLQAVSAGEQDRQAKTYVWFVEHPTDAPCVRQTNPTIAEKIVGSTNEKIRGTNVWKLTFRYE